MSLISSNRNSDFNPISDTRNRNKLVKSSSTTVNNYSIYDKYICKVSLNKNCKNKNKKNNIKNNNLSNNNKLKNMRRLNSPNSINLSNYEGNSKIVKKNIYAFNKIMENYLQQKNIELLQRKKNSHIKSFNNKNIISDSNINNSNLYLSTNRKVFSGYNLTNNHLNQITKNKNESMNLIRNNKIRLRRNKNLSMRDIDNFSGVKSLKHMNNTNYRKENYYSKNNCQIQNNTTNKKIKNESSPDYYYTNVKNYTFNNNNTNNSRCNSKKNIIKNKCKSTRRIDSKDLKVNDLEKKYELLINNKTNNIKNFTSSRNNSCKIHNNNYTIKSGDSEITKPNTLNEKIEKKDDGLEGPEIIHFSLVTLIQKGNKKMKEISLNTKKKK